MSAAVISIWETLVPIKDGQGNKIQNLESWEDMHQKLGLGWPYLNYNTEDVRKINAMPPRKRTVNAVVLS